MTAEPSPVAAVAPPSPSRLRRLARGLLLVFGGLMIALAIKAIEVSRESRELRAVRQAWSYDNASGQSWQREVAFTGTPAVMALVRTAGGWWGDRLPAEARWALGAMEQASVAIYRVGGPLACPTERLVRADAVLSSQGWSRRLGVCESDQVVGIYTRNGVGRTPRLCIVVGDGKQVVLVSGGLREAAFDNWPAAWTFGEMRSLAGL